MLEEELQTYNNTKAGLQQQYGGDGYVVILGDEILGVWQTRMDALKAGLEKYGDVQFLVRDISAKIQLATYSRNLHFV